jgi:type IV pilus assembly protein PilE
MINIETMDCVMRPNKQRGFTLIELMMALTIVVILAAIAVPAYRNYIATARETEGHNNLAALQMAQEEYFSENNAYFAGADTATLETNSNGLWTATGSDGVNNFDYAVVASGGGYTATATGNGNKVPASVVLTVTK